MASVRALNQAFLALNAYGANLERTTLLDGLSNSMRICLMNWLVMHLVDRREHLTLETGIEVEVLFIDRFVALITAFSPLLPICI